MDVSVLVGLRNMSVSIVYGCRFISRFKKFVCFMPLCIRFILAVNSSGPVFV